MNLTDSDAGASSAVQYLGSCLLAALRTVDSGWAARAACSELPSSLQLLII